MGRPAGLTSEPTIQGVLPVQLVEAKLVDSHFTTIADALPNLETDWDGSKGAKVIYVVQFTYLCSHEIFLISTLLKVG